MSVAWITNDWIKAEHSGTIIPGGCAYYRCYLPAAVLGQRSRLGYPVWDGIRGFGVKENDRLGVFGFTNVMLKLIMDRSTPKQVELAQHLGQRIYVDIDDHYEGLTQANLAYDLTNPETNKRTNRAYYQSVIMAADVVTVSTPFLYELWSNRRDNVHMVRNGVNTHQFTPIKHINRKPIIGWVGSTAFRNNDLEILREWLPDFLEEHDLTFHHSGWDKDHPGIADMTGIDPKRITISPSVPINRYDSLFTFDIGIVPLNDIPFNEAKSNIKGLEYAAKGIPFVASALPEYRLLHETGVGSIANTPEEWTAHLTRLLDYRQRRIEANRARDIVSQQWAIEHRAADWQAVFNSEQSP